MGELAVTDVDKHGGKRIVHVVMALRFVPVSMALLAVMWVLQAAHLQQAVGGCVVGPW